MPGIPSISAPRRITLQAIPAVTTGRISPFPFVARLSYLNQLIVSRKFGEKVGIQMAPTFVYYNAVTEGYRNDNYSLNFGGRFQVMGLQLHYR